MAASTALAGDPNVDRSWRGIVGFIAILIIDFCGSAVYGTAAIATTLKVALELSQVKLNVLALMGFWPTALTLPLGYAMSHGLGTRILMVVSVALALVGDLVLRAVVNGDIANDYGLVVFAFFCFGLQQTLLYFIAVDLVNHYCTPFSLGSSMILMLLPFGVGASLWPVIFNQGLDLSLAGWFLLQAILGAVCFLCMAFIAGFGRLRVGVGGRHEAEKEPLLADEGEERGEHPEIARSAPQSLWRVLRAAMQDWTYWVEIGAIYLSFGTSLTASMNLGSIADSIDPSNDVSDELILALWGVGQTAGRAVASFLVVSPPCGLQERGLTLFVISLVLQIAAYLVAILDLTPTTLIPFVILVGVSYGLLWTVIVQVTISERAYPAFAAVTVLGVNVTLCALIGHTTFNFVASALYDDVGFVAPDGSTQCVGQKCFARSFLIFIAAAAAAFVAVVALFVRKTCRLGKDLRSMVIQE